MIAFLKDKALLITALLFSFSFSHSLSSEPIYRLVSISGLIEQEIGALLMVPIFVNAGLELDIAPMPAERARMEVVQGRRDGDILRIFSYGESNPSLLRVPTPYYEVKTTAFAKEANNIQIRDKSDLANYRIAIVRGVQTTKDLTLGLDNVMEFTRLEQAIRFVEADRADIFITSEIAAYSLLNQLNIPDMEAVYQANSEPLYLYLNPFHRDALEKIDRSIQTLQNTGQLATLTRMLEDRHIGTKNHSTTPLPKAH